jgi:hypothetical protein
MSNSDVLSTEDAQSTKPKTGALVTLRAPSARADNQKSGAKLLHGPAEAGGCRLTTAEGTI